jgi:hypothetical protein
MKVEKADNKNPIAITSKRKMARITIVVDASTPMHLEFAPANIIPWMIHDFVFNQKLEFHVFGVRGGKISDSELEIEWLSIRWNQPNNVLADI